MKGDIPEITILTKGDIDKTNNLRTHLYNLGADAYDVQPLRQSQANIDKINSWLNRERRVGDMMETASVVMITISSQEWNTLSRTTNKGIITRTLNNLMNQTTDITGETLWDFVQRRRTSSQVASGLALDRWEPQTVRAFMQAADEVARVYRG